MRLDGVIYDVCKKPSFGDLFNELLPEFGINNQARVAAFLAQIFHESGRLRYTKEIWGPTKQQLKYEPGTTLAMRLGNTELGDGKKYMGRGFLQITGRENYSRITKRLRLRFGSQNVPNFTDQPHKLSEPFWALASACDFWLKSGLNEIADSHDFVKITRKINGGLTGFTERQSLHAQVKVLLILHDSFSY